MPDVRIEHDRYMKFIQNDFHGLPVIVVGKALEHARPSKDKTACSCKPASMFELPQPACQGITVQRKTFQVP